MDWGRRLATAGGLECTSPHVVARWEVKAGGEGFGGVGHGTGCGGSLWGGGDV